MFIGMIAVAQQTVFLQNALVTKTFMKIKLYIYFLMSKLQTLIFTYITSGYSLYKMSVMLNVLGQMKATLIDAIPGITQITIPKHGRRLFSHNMLYHIVNCQSLCVTMPQSYWVTYINNYNYYDTHVCVHEYNT